MAWRVHVLPEKMSNTTPISYEQRSGQRLGSPSPGQDRRVHPRLQMSVEIDFQSAHNFYSARLRDISVGGLFIETEIGLPIGTKLYVDLRFLETRARVAAEVVWAMFDKQGRSVGVGVRFVSLSDKVRERIERFMGIRPAFSFGEAEVEEDVTPSIPPSTR